MVAIVERGSPEISSDAGIYDIGIRYDSKHTDDGFNNNFPSTRSCISGLTARADA